jgi:miniconductance mechanosensitive channel
MIFIGEKKPERNLMIYWTKTAKYIAHLIPLLFIYKSVPVILSVMNTGRSVFEG